MPDDRVRLRSIFDSVADDYQQARPDYPAELYDSVVQQAGIRPGDRLLEVGCATGKATLPLARRGFLITCLEIGPALAAAARQNLAGFARVDVIQADFETWRPARAPAFDLVFAATAWHWIDPAVKYRRAWEHLRPGGHLAVWDAVHVAPAGGDTFFDDLQEVYDEIGEGRPSGAAIPRPDELPDGIAEAGASGSSAMSPSAASTGRSATRRTGTSACSTRSPATSTWPPGSATACTARSAAAWPTARTGGCAGTGARSCEWPADATTQRRCRARQAPTRTRLNGAVPRTVTASG
jgi:SAM-dependent methyltransferase